MNHNAHPSTEAEGGASRDAGHNVGSQRLEDLLRGVSHDLKSPLSAIMMTAASLARIPIDEGATPQVRRKAETIQRCAERIAKVIDDLLDVASLQCGGLTIETDVHDASAMVGEALQKVRAIADERGVALDTALIETTLPGVSCDRARIVQVMTSLLANAIAVTEEGSSVVIGAHRAHDELELFVRGAAPATVRDESGRGPDNRPRNRGAAVALTIANGIVAAHGGRLCVEHGRDGGRVTFTVPLAPGER